MRTIVLLATVHIFGVPPSLKGENGSAVSDSSLRVCGGPQAVCFCCCTSTVAEKHGIEGLHWVQRCFVSRVSPNTILVGGSSVQTRDSDGKLDRISPPVHVSLIASVPSRQNRNVKTSSTLPRHEWCRIDDKCTAFFSASVPPGFQIVHTSDSIC